MSFRSGLEGDRPCKHAGTTAHCNFPLPKAGPDRPDCHPTGPVPCPRRSDPGTFYTCSAPAAAANSSTASDFRVSKRSL